MSDQPKMDERSANIQKVLKAIQFFIDNWDTLTAIRQREVFVNTCALLVSALEAIDALHECPHE